MLLAFFNLVTRVENLLYCFIYKVKLGAREGGANRWW